MHARRDWSTHSMLQASRSVHSVPIKTIMTHPLNTTTFLTLKLPAMGRLPTTRIPRFGSVSTVKKILRSCQALAVHKFKKHGIKRQIRYHVGDITACPACMMQFHTRERLLTHLGSKSPICSQFVIDHFPRLDAELFESLEAQSLVKDTKCKLQQGRSRFYTDNKSVFRLIGPLPFDFKSCRGHVSVSRNRYLAI